MIFKRKFFIFLSLFFLIFLTTHCSKVSLSFEDAITFDEMTDISSASIIDLDKNQKNEIILASLTYRTNEYGERIPQDSSIFVFEKNTKKYKYIWKSSPLNYLTPTLSVVPEHIYKIQNDIQTNNINILVFGEKKLYKLFFKNEYYHLDIIKNLSEYQPPNQDIPSYFSFPIRSFYLFSNNNKDYIFLNTGKKKESKLSIYEVQYHNKENIMKKIFEQPIEPCITLKGVKLDKKIYLLASTTSHNLKIYTINGLGH